MKKYALRRLLQLIPILFAITFLSYGMMRIAGSDVVTQKMENTGQVVSEDTLNAAREQLGLDKPFLTQYFVWLGKLLRGDMGNSYDQAFRFLIRLYQTSGYITSYSYIYSAYNHYIYSSGNFVSDKAEFDYRLSDSFVQLYREQPS